MSKWFQQLIASLYAIVTVVSDYLFPKTEIERELEALSPAEFAAKATQCTHTFDLCSITGINTRALYEYRNVYVETAVKLIKYGGNARATQLIGQLLAADIAKNIHMYEGAVLVPVPISKRRMRERGYNQAERVTRVAFEELQRSRPASAPSFIFEPSLLTKSHRKSLTSQTREERARSIKDCFSVNEKVAKRYSPTQFFLIIDDVFTTGATLCEAVKKLMECGFQNIAAITVAHTEHKN